MKILSARTMLVGGLAATLALIGGTAGAATSVSVTGTIRTGDSLAVSGTSSFDDQPFVEVGTDAPNDSVPPGPAGYDLLAASVRTTASGRLEFRWTLNGAPPVLNGTDMTFLGWTFCLGGDDNCYEIDAGRFYNSPDQADYTGAVWLCADSACDFGGQSLHTSAVNVSVVNTPAETATVTASVALSELGATPGDLVTPVVLHPDGAAFIAFWEWYTGLTGIFFDVGDGLTVNTDYTVPGRGVSLAVGDPGQNPDDIEYTSFVSPAADGTFTGTLNVTGLTGAKSVYARACLGEGNCGTTTHDLTL